MKVVLFCGGLGMRLREYSHAVPKPLIPVGNRPLLWHLMRYYAHYGHREFILCLGYGGDSIREYFASCSGGVANGSGDDWAITFADTGLDASVGERLKAVEGLLEGEETFLANYADGLSDCPLPDLITWARKQRTVATMLSVRPSLSYHAVETDPRGVVTTLQELPETGLRVNGGFFVFRHEIFRYLREGEDLVLEPFQRLVRLRHLTAYRYDGFWLAVDTMKDKQKVDDLVAAGNCPWQVWKTAALSVGS